MLASGTLSVLATPGFLILIASSAGCSLSSRTASQTEKQRQSADGLALEIARTEHDYTVVRARSLRTPDGVIYVLGPLRSADGGKTLGLCSKSDPQWGTALNETEMNTLFARKGLYIALRNKLVCQEGGRCVGKMWRSFDDLKTIREEDTLVLVPEAGKVDNGKRGNKYGGGFAGSFDEWVGLFFHRRIIEMPDGSLLAAMYGNFEHDTIVPTDPRSLQETKYKSRVFVVRSTDQGGTWRYLATVVSPRPGVVDDTEGFNEWSLQQLADGRLLAVMRTGHYTPLVASWSSDGGKNWTEPKNPLGLEPGVDPYLLRLSDGRLALAYGQIVQRVGPRKADWRQEDQRRRCQLAIDEDGTGERWVASTVADFARRSAYPTIFEVEPGLILYQAGLEIWRVMVPSTRLTKSANQRRLSQ